MDALFPVVCLMNASAHRAVARDSSLSSSGDESFAQEFHHRSFIGIVFVVDSDAIVPSPAPTAVPGPEIPDEGDEPCNATLTPSALRCAACDE